MALRTLFAVSNAGSPTMDHGLFIGGFLRYRSIAARIVLRGETYLFRLSASLRHKTLSGSRSFSSSFFISSIGVSNPVWLENHSVKIANLVCQKDGRNSSCKRSQINGNIC